MLFVVIGYGYLFAKDSIKSEKRKGKREKSVFSSGPTHEKIPQDMSFFSVWQELNIDRQRPQGPVYETSAGHLACIAGELVLSDYKSR
jgi:hypothetical protein